MSITSDLNLCQLKPLDIVEIYSKFSNEIDSAKSLSNAKVFFAQVVEYANIFYDFPLLPKNKSQKEKDNN